MEIKLNQFDIDSSFFDYDKINSLYDFFLIENKGNSFKPDSDILYEPLIKKMFLPFNTQQGQVLLSFSKKIR